MMRLDLLLCPNLKTTSMKVANLLKNMGWEYEILLLNLPEEMEDLVDDLASNRISYDELIDETLRSHILPEPIGSWEYSVKPILRALPQLSRMLPDVRVCCYGSSDHEFASMGVAVRVARLTLRTTLTGKVEADKWRTTLNHSIDVDGRAKIAEVEAILDLIDGSSVCVSDMGGRDLKDPLTTAGLDVKIHYVEKPHHFSPLTILKRKLVRGPVGDEEVEKYVRCHVDYLRGYIYRFKSRDRAYFEWVHDMVPWMRHRIDKDEVYVLDSIILQY